jgi:ATP-dependent Clp protease ATP-binding subunit ClpA
VADRIFDGMVDELLREAALSGHRVAILPEAREALRELCVSDLSNGGRGVRNKLEAHLTNPLARALFDRDGDGPVVVRRVEPGAVTCLHLESA